MSYLRKLVHLQEQLGHDRFAVLIDSGNTGKVKEFCDQLLKDTLPTKMTVGGRTYEILGFLKGNEKSVVGHVMVDRAREMNANLGKEEAEHILSFQSEIPACFENKMKFLFTDSDDKERIFVIRWEDEERKWVSDRYWLRHDYGCSFGEEDCFLRLPAGR